MANKKVKKKRPVVLASGVFDLLHLGHVKFLEEAKKAGGKNAELVVIVARDSTVENRKGEKPTMREDQRRALVESLKVVDEAILGYENFTMDEVIDKIKPQVIAMGYDQKDMTKAVEEAIARKKLKIRVVRIGKFGEDELGSSSEIKRKIIEEYKRHS
jgi:FAD synthetase